MTMLITMTNVCFSVINDNVDYYDYLVVEIVSVFKGWIDIVKNRLGLSAIWWRRALRVVEDFVFPLTVLLRGALI